MLRLQPRLTAFTLAGTIWKRGRRGCCSADAIIGLGLKTVEQANSAPLDHLDYVAIGGMFATRSKDNPDAPVGLAGLREIAAVVRQRAPPIPIAAIPE